MKLKTDRSPLPIHIGPFSAKALEDLIENKILALVVPDFVQSPVIAALRRTYSSLPLEDYKYFDQKSNTYMSLGIKRSGAPFNSTYQGDRQAIDNYYLQVPDLIQEIRARTLPFLSPIDHLRLLVDESWIGGACLASFTGRKNFVGIFRYAESATSSLGEKPHFDSLPPEKCPLLRQLAANIYLDVPQNGGELLLWDTDEVAHEELAAHQSSEDFARSVSVSPRKVSPEPGMLAIFNTRKPHAVSEFSGGVRSSMQCFIGLQADHRLVFWN